MNDWTPGSKRMIWSAVAALGAWLAGVLLGLMAVQVHASASSASATLLVCSLLISGPVLVWSALQLPRGPYRWTWGLIALGLVIDVFSLSASVVHNMLDPLSAGPFVGGVGTTLLGYLPICVGVGLAVNSLWAIPNRRSAWLQATAISVGLLVAMAAALIAPGPAMPFSIGPRDVPGLVRMAIDVLLIFLPAAYCTIATLRLPHGHRARMWLWLAVGALLWTMSDVSAPLVDLGHGQVYPMMLWILGVHLMTMGASLAVDFELEPADA
jgi:hypothetical protein